MAASPISWRYDVRALLVAGVVALTGLFLGTGAARAGALASWIAPSVRAAHSYGAAVAHYDATVKPAMHVTGVPIRRGTLDRSIADTSGRPPAPPGVFSAPNTTGAGALTSSQRARYLFDNWHPATFPNRTQSIGYHLAKHGKGRSAFDYTRDAQQFLSQNRNLATPVTLRDGTSGLRIQTKVPLPGGGTNNIGGYWTSDGRLVTFWD